MADSMCGPSNGLKSISRHFDANRPEQRDRVNTNGFQQPFAQDQRPRQDAAFASFQQGTASLAEANPASNLRQPLPPTAAHGYHMPGPYSPVFNPHPQPTVPNTSPDAQVPGHNMANASQYHLNSTRTFARSTGPLNQTYPSPPVQAGPSSGHPMTTYPLNHPPAPSMIPGGMHFGYRPMPSLMAGGLEVNSPSLPLQHQQPQAANTSATDDFDFDAELSAWMDRNSLQDPPQASEELQEGARDTRADQAENTLADVGFPTSEPANAFSQAEPEQDTIPANDHDDDRELQQDLRRIAEEHERLLWQDVGDMELAAAAQGLIDSLSNDTNERIQNSRFLHVMRQVASMNLVVRGDRMVDPETLDEPAYRDPTQPSPATDSNTESYRNSRA
ncbi:hypothetical protein F5Y05DRAFT_255921 [Hypoxylon sp. FL0543]|nr:hypothetical protein F5Y05DRAFT_255921 [Hypoxylon sp. FL0543]